MRTTPLSAFSMSMRRRLSCTTCKKECGSSNWYCTRENPADPPSVVTRPSKREELGEGRPEPFDFLGFTHFCTRSRKWGSFVIGRKTIKKRMLRQLQAVKMELCKRMHDPIAKTGAWLNQMLKGYLNYYAVSGNSPSLWWGTSTR